MIIIKEDKKKKRNKWPYDSKTITTGNPALNLDFFNKCMGTDTIPDDDDKDESETPEIDIPEVPTVDVTAGEAGGDTGGEAGGDGGAGMGESLSEAKRDVRRYYIRPQNIFCSNKAEVIRALIDVGNNNCSVYTLKNIEDNDDVHKLTTKDIIYYYDDGILYDKNKVRVMDYDLYIKHEEERKRFTGNPDLVSDAEFNKEYADRITDRTDVDESLNLVENSILYEVSKLKNDLVEEHQEVLLGTKNEPEAADEWNKRRDAKQYPLIEADEDYSYTQINAFYDSFEEKFIIFRDYVGTKNHKMPSITTETFTTFDELLEYASSLTLEKPVKKEGLKRNMKTLFTEKFDADKLIDLLEESNVVEPIFLGYNMEDADLQVVGDDQYGNTEFYAYKDDGKYFIVKTYVSHHGEEKDGPITEFASADEIIDFVSHAELYDCPFVGDRLLDEEAFNLDFVGVNAFNESIKPKYTCCICGEDFEGYGNNPVPYKDEGTCCDACNVKFVIPARLAQYQAEYSMDDEKKDVKESVEPALQSEEPELEIDPDFECYDCFDMDKYANDPSDDELIATGKGK